MAKTTVGTPVLHSMLISRRVPANQGKIRPFTIRRKISQNKYMPLMSKEVSHFSLSISHF